ncbi:SUKH-4 family immunity protein [Streptomyces sp. HD]|uniref:SUKH-4 family immunity protein n=1 Tax=Streptomyces sp. HD TaxID=3020892 RepID=UPI0023304F23|nr:SUKH-4 family immunity protein [Streptomyces sp. HD]MDC0766754.1 SUKH-4 family immunity protein [Streptomyces sp. HD]
MNEDLDDVLADPARLLTADRAAVRHHLASEDGTQDVGREGLEVFLQAEAIFGSGNVTRAEFASWLHFAAKATGHDEYAEGIAKAEPGMPWRTVWAWWRPANWFVTHPSLNGDYYQVHRRLHEGRLLIEVATDWRGCLWLDAETGDRVRLQVEDTLPAAPLSREALDAPELNEWNLTAPESWEGAVAFAAEGGRTRYLVQNASGLAVIETDAEVLRDWPRGEGIDWGSAEEALPETEPEVRRPEGPLTADRVDDAFGERYVLRLPESDLPEGLEHPGSRRYLRDIGLPTMWLCHGGQYKARRPEAMRPPTDDELPKGGLPDGVTASDLISFGTVDYGELYLHRHDGSVHIWSRLGGATDRTLVPLAPDLDVFTRVLEAVYRYSNACWHPYLVEGGQDAVAEVFMDEIDELSPGLFDRKTPCGEVWSWLYAGITELGVDGF